MRCRPPGTGDRDGGQHSRLGRRCCASSRSAVRRSFRGVGRRYVGFSRKHSDRTDSLARGHLPHHTVLLRALTVAGLGR